MAQLTIRLRDAAVKHEDVDTRADDEETMRDDG